jgi:hypothetical protein
METSILETSILETSILETSILETSILETSILETKIMEKIIESPPPPQNSAKVDLTKEDEAKLIKVKNYINGFKTQIESLKKTNKQLLEYIESFKKTNKQLLEYLDEKNQEIFSILIDNENNISDIENNMQSCYVENWHSTDSNGIPVIFSGNIHWIKGSGTIHYNIERTYFKGVWDSTGKIKNGTLFNHMHDPIKKWDYGQLVEEQEPDAENGEDDAEYDSEDEYERLHY